MQKKIYSLFIGIVAIAFVLTFGTSNSFSLTSFETTPGQEAAAEPAFKGSLKTGVLLQIGFEYGLNDYTNNKKFYYQAVRLYAVGKVHPKVKYFLMIKGEGLMQPAGAPLAGIEKAWLMYIHSPALKIKFGGEYLAFNRSFHGHIGKLLMIQRPIANTSFGHQADTGLELSGSVMKDKLHYWIGVWNGSGGLESGVKSASNNSFLTTVRLQFDPMGKWLDNGQWLKKEMKATVGLGIYYAGASDSGSRATASQVGTAGHSMTQTASTATTGSNRVESVLGITIDGGFSTGDIFVKGAYTMFSGKVPDKTEFGTDAGLDLEGYSSYTIQIAGTIMPKFLIGVVRYDHFDTEIFKELDSAGLDDYIDRVTIGLTIYPTQQGHKFKIQPEVYFDITKKSNGIDAVDATMGDASTKQMGFKVLASLLF